MKIFLCDFVHNYLGAGTYMFPLNIGYLAAYAKIFFKDNIEIELFKYPNDLLKELNINIPQIVGFSNYSWNTDLNNKISKFIKSKYPDIIVIFGGPNIDYTENKIRDFFTSYLGVDFYIPFQGETPFINLLKKILEYNFDIKKLKQEYIDGIYFYNEKLDKVFMGKTLNRIKNLDEIPSPYLTGTLDKFFYTNLIPIIETNRGCPYQCTFCCQGISSFHQINFFSLERVKSEINYISEHIKNTNLLHLADSNFGIVDRDIEISKYLVNSLKKSGYPYKTNSNLAKNQPKIYEIAKILNNINLVVSLQSLDEEVLKKIKRSNINISIFKDIIDKVNETGGISGTEIILGLPGETKDSHIKTLKKLFDWDVSFILCYNCLILQGSELSLFRENGTFKCSTKFRLIDSSFGKYANGIVSFESEEGIRSTDKMSEDEILFFRPVHWLIQFLWNYRFYYDLLKLIKKLGSNPLDYIMKLIENTEKSEKINEIFNEFQQEARLEWFNSLEELQNYYNRQENFKMLEKGEYGKMNGKYIFKVLLEAKEDFENYLYNTAINLPNIGRKNQEILKELISFLSNSIIDLNQLFEYSISKEKTFIFKYNFNEWKKSGYQKDLNDLYNPKGFKIHFYLTEVQEESLKKLLAQYIHKNKNVTLRKMSEFMQVSDFKYNTEIIE